MDSRVDPTKVLVSKVVTDTTIYQRILFQMGELSYRMDNETLKPEIVYKGKTYRSTNVMGSADSWRHHNRGTSGKCFAPEKLERFQLTLMYEEGILRTYINGLLDQNIALEK